MTSRTVLFSLALLALSSTASAASRSGSPNILLIIADDLGYADLGAYGSDIRTPTIDTLAREGILFTQFHSAPLCEPARAMLLSGNNNHVAGVARQSHAGVSGVPANLVPGVPLAGYENQLSDRVVPFPRLLRDAGYDTYSVGKWHLGLEPENSPHAAGFSRSFNLLQSAGTHFDSKGYYEGGSLYREGKELAQYPEGRYSTDFYTEKLLQFIDADKDNGKPFFAYAAYTSPHWPMQVPDEYLNLYSGSYDDGYDVLRERRFDSLKEAGVIPLDSALPPRNEAVTPWDQLSKDEQRRESRKMELYAAMVDNLDDHIGRLVDYLKDNNLYENTLIVFMADNGAAAEDFYNSGAYREYIRANFDNSYEKMGTAESFVSYGAPWAEASSAPFQRHKGHTTEGGIVAPMIISGKGVNFAGAIDSTYVTVMDFAPTFLELADARYPDDGSVKPMLGESMNDFLRGRADSIHDEDYVTVLSHAGRSLLRQGRWKIVTRLAPFNEADFELYDVIADPGEMQDLAKDEPEKMAELIALWRAKRKELGIILPEDL